MRYVRTCAGLTLAVAALGAGCATTSPQPSVPSSVPAVAAQADVPAVSRLQVAPAAQPGLFSLQSIPSDRQKVEAAISALIGGLERRDAQSLAPLYMPDRVASFYSPLWASTGGVQNAVPRERHLQLMASCLAAFSAVRVMRDGPGELRIGDGLAIWTGTGVNDVTYNTGARSMSNWRWTVVLEKDQSGRWFVTHEHSSFEPAQLKP